MKAAIVLLVLFAMAFTAVLPLCNSLESDLYEANLHNAELEPQEPVPLPEDINAEDGIPAIDCQGFFLNIFGC